MANLDLIKLYSQPQQGGELPYFVGKQYGSGWLRTIGRFAFPILRKLGLMAANTAEDVIMNNKEILPTIKEHGMKAVNSILPGLFNNGSGVKTAKTAKSFNRSLASIANRKHKSKTSKAGINKRRRIHGTIFK
jgi:hypothetical protein